VNNGSISAELPAELTPPPRFLLTKRPPQTHGRFISDKHIAFRSGHYQIPILHIDLQKRFH
jgi:hypothetical protein